MTNDEATAELLRLMAASGTILAGAPASVPDDYVYSDGVRKADVIAAIQAAGAAEHYVYAERLCVYYNLHVCVRCAGPHPHQQLLGLGYDTWGSICDGCAEVVGRRTAARWAGALPKLKLPK